MRQHKKKIQTRMSIAHANECCDHLLIFACETTTGEFNLIMMMELEVSICLWLLVKWVSEGE